MTTRVEIESERIARVPGIEFAAAGSGRLARVAGSGVAVFEVMRTYTVLGGDMALVKKLYDWLSREQIAALRTTNSVSLNSESPTCSASVYPFHAPLLQPTPVMGVPLPS